MSHRRLSFKILFTTTIVGIFLAIGGALAQTSRSLQGHVSLDVSTAVRDLSLDITVNNHSLVVLPPPFGIIRPIQSSVTTRVVIAQGESGTNYFMSGIDDDPVDYTVMIRCIGCANIIPTQYYSSGGNKFGISNSVYIDPDDLPAQLDLSALTLATITGDINLATPASRDLHFTVKVANAANPNITLTTDDSLRINQGDSNISYQISGLSRSINAYQLSLRCNNCIGSARRERIYNGPLSTQENHTGIDFIIDSEGSLNSPAILLLLLRNEDN